MKHAVQVESKKHVQLHKHLQSSAVMHPYTREVPEQRAAITTYSLQDRQKVYSQLSGAIKQECLDNKQTPKRETSLFVSNPVPSREEERDRNAQYNRTSKI